MPIDRHDLQVADEVGVYLREELAGFSFWLFRSSSVFRTEFLLALHPSDDRLFQQGKHVALP
jgi:hypothetical protein